MTNDERPMTKTEVDVREPVPGVEGTAAVGFKEWALVCAALGQGRQSLILRKGGIAEGRGGFHFKHERFFLFPTQYHEQASKVRAAELGDLRPAAPALAGTVAIPYLCQLEWAEWVNDWAALARLEPFHVWTEEVVRERFAYDSQTGLQCALARVYRLDPVWTFPDRPAYGGCRSWVNLPEWPDSLELSPVVTDRRHAEVTAAVRAALHGSS